MPGPPPKKDSERTRRNTPESGAARHDLFLPVTIPNADVKNWHPRATALFNSLKTSGQASSYQDSDWAVAKILCDYLTKCYESGFKAMDMTNITAMLGRLGCTEGDRRQILRLELEHEQEKPTSAGDAAVIDIKTRLTQRPAS